MGCFYTKAGLYTKTKQIRKHFGFDPGQLPIDTLDLCDGLERVTLGFTPFKTRALRGIAHISEMQDRNDVIILNSDRSREEQVFDAAHELMHLCMHRKEATKEFNCYEAVRPEQNAFLEWHANEGAAEFLVPHRVFLPYLKNNYSVSWECEDIKQFKQNAAKEFGVPEITIKFRLESLKYEIWQYLNGIALDDLTILSAKKQASLGIQIDSLNDREEQSELYDRSVLVGHPVLYRKRCTDSVKVYI